MIAYEASLTYQLVQFEAADPLATPRQMLAFLTKDVLETPQESFWLLAMNPKHRPICRQRIASGPCVTVHVNVLKVFLGIALAEAKAFACLRLQPGGSVIPNLADGRLLFDLQEMSRLCHVEFVDYLIACLDAREFHSCRKGGELRD